MTNKDLYENIMHKISKIVKEALNESFMNDKEGDFEINPTSQQIEQEYIQKQKVNEFYENEIPKNVTEYDIPYGVWQIPEKKFYDCKSLTSITIPNSVQSIGDSAFSWTSLTSIVMPNSVKSIGEMSFYRCKKLISAVIPNSVQSIGEGVFGLCESLTSIVIPNSVQNIGDATFSWCTSLSSLNIPNSIRSIGEYAFYRCKTLTSVVIPNSVQSIGDYAFKKCISLSSVEYDGVVYTSEEKLKNALEQNGVTLGNEIFDDTNLKP